MDHFMNDSGSVTDLEGCLDRITFYNPENHYTIAKFRPRGAQNAITVVGFMPAPTAGEFLKPHSRRIPEAGRHLGNACPLWAAA
ncbi:MAG: hypothetical protein NTU74_05320 [Deltaproteobacteria bacterium]|nr:hypothetical protein [Deltaproteobacteria bacterium]